MEERIIGNVKYTRAPATCHLTGAAYTRYAEFVLVPGEKGFETRVYTNPDNTPVMRQIEVQGLPVWQPSRQQSESPSQRFDTMVNGLRIGHPLARGRTPAEIEIDKARASGLGLIADRLAADNPPPPDELIQPDGALFTVNAERLMQGIGLGGLLFSPDEIRAWLNRHVLGDGGLNGSFVPSDAHPSEDENFKLPWAGPKRESAAALISGHGLVRSQFGVYRPDVDSPNAPVSPEHRQHPILFKKRTKADWVQITTLLVPGRPTRTLVYTNKDTFTSRWN